MNFLPSSSISLFSIFVLCFILSCAQKPAKVIDKSHIKYSKSNQYNIEKYKNINLKKFDKNSSERNKNNAEETLKDQISKDEIIVEEGETLYSISRKYQVSLRELIDYNKLVAPYFLKKGEKIKIPSPIFHETKEGETLYSISRFYNMKVDDLITLNNLKFPYAIHTGDRIKVSNFSKTSTEKPLEKKLYDKQTIQQKVFTQESQPKKPDPTTEAKNSNTLDSKNKEEELKETQPSVKPKKIKFVENTLDKINHFSWPVRGKIISNFGPKNGGLYNDGINIKASEGQKVLASEDGVVAYVGNELKGYGNLIIIKHSGGWITAYAHLKDTTISSGQKVKKGNKIGTVGTSGKVDSPQLYFGLRKGHDAVNPENYLHQ